MELVAVGKLVNTHGLKGEVKVKSDFERKELIFKKGKFNSESSHPPSLYLSSRQTALIHGTFAI